MKTPPKGFMGLRPGVAPAAIGSGRSEWLEIVWPRCIVTLIVLALAVSLVYAARAPGLHDTGSVADSPSLAGSSNPAAPAEAARGSDSDRFDEEADGVLDEIHRASAVCMRGVAPRRVTARVTFAPNGEAANVQIEERVGMGDKTADCLETMFGLAHVHPFAGPPRTVTRYWDVR